MNSNTVYGKGLAPLREMGLITARKNGLNGPWYWRKKGFE